MPDTRTDFQSAVGARPVASPLTQTIPASPARDPGFANRLITQSETLRDKLLNAHESLDRVLGFGPRTDTPQAEPNVDPRGQLEHVESTLSYSHELLDNLAARLRHL